MQNPGLFHFFTNNFFTVYTINEQTVCVGTGLSALFFRIVI